MKTSRIFLSLLASAAFVVASNLNAATTSVVGYTSTTLPAGAGNLFAPAFVNSDSFVGTLTGATAGETSTLTISGTVTANAFDETQDDPGVSKGYPQYYVEVLNDTDAGDSIDTEGLIIDIASNTTSTVDVAADISALGIQGNEQVSIRKHLTLGDIFDGASGLTQFTDSIAIYNEDGPGTVVSHLPDGSGGFVLGTDFVTTTTDAPVYPGTGIVINAAGALTITPTGVVKESDTQVSIYGNSVVNVVGAFKPISSITLSEDGRLNDALMDFTDSVSTYTTDGSLVPDTNFLSSGETSFVLTDFTTPTDPAVDGTFQAFVISAGTDTVYKLSGTVIPES